MKRFFTLLLSLAMVLSLVTPVWAAGPSFSDVPTSHWAYAYVERAVQEGWINGMGGGRYAPEEPVSYAQFVTMVGRIYYQDAAAASTEQEFWWSSYMDVACQGFAGGTEWLVLRSAETEPFGGDAVDQPVTRLDMAYMLYNVVEEQAPDRLPTAAERQDAARTVADFDRYDEHWTEQLSGVVAMGLITGVDSVGTFAGQESMTRAQAATVLCRLYDYVNGSEAQQPEESKEPETPAPEESKPSTGSAIDIAAWEQEVFELVNEIRVENGLAEFEYDDTLADVARAHSQDMIDRNFFDHYNPDGASPFDRMKAAGIRYTMAAENIAAGYPSPESVVEGWMNSPGHRANILSGNKYLGVGLALGGSYGYYWTQCFAKY